ncbi:MAG: right-handed parallel beta-helix repeat-containing protein [Cellulosilyticaceae bacterium]
MKKSANYYVACWGNDQYDGSMERPFETIERAQNEVRTCILQGKLPQGGITVAVREGIYNIEGLIFDERDSGTADCPIIYTNYEQENVILNGGIYLSSKEFITVEGAMRQRLSPDVAPYIRCIDLKKYGITAANYGKLYAVGAFNTASKYDGDTVGDYPCELFYNNNRMTIARYPSASDYLKIEYVHDIGECYEPSPQDYQAAWLDQRNPRGGTFQVDPLTRERMCQWAHIEDAWVFGYFYWDWADMSTPIQSIDGDKGTVTTTFCSRYGFKKDARYYFYNIFEELDTPGEYYLDREEGILYLYPLGPIEDASIQITLSTKSLIEVKSGAAHLVFDGLGVEATRGEGVNLGGEYCIMKNCKVSNIAQSGIVVTGRYNVVDRCEISHVGKNGITLGGGDQETLDIGGNIATHNHIHQYGEIQKTYTAGVYITGVANHILHNEIHDAPHMGLFYSGNDHLIEYNELYHVVLQSSDAGAIYTGYQLCEYGNIIRYNYIHHIGSDHFKPQGIYFDDGMAGQVAYGNVLESIPDCGFLIGSGRDNKVSKNLVIDAGTPISFDGRLYEGFHSQGWFKHAVMTKEGTYWQRLVRAKTLNCNWGHRYPEIDRMNDTFNNWEDPNFAINPAGTEIVGNVICSTQTSIGYIAPSSAQYAKVEGNQIYELDLSQDIKRKYCQVLDIPFDKIGRI